MSIISPLTYTIANGQAVDAVPLMADFNQIVSNVNANAVASASLAASGGAGLVGYSQGASGSVLRTQAEKNQEFVSVLDFGADPTGVADSTAAIQAAINSGSLYIFFPHGTYLTSGAHSLDGKNGITLEGAGVGATNIVLTSATNDLFNTATTPTFNVDVGHMTISANVTRTAGWVFRVNDVYNGTGSINQSYFHDLLIENQLNGIWFTRYAGTSLANVIGVSWVGSGGIGVKVGQTTSTDVNQGSQLTLSNLNVFPSLTGGSPVLACGLWIEDTDAVFAENCSFGGVTQDVLHFVANSGGHTPSNHFFSNCSFDSTQSGNILNYTAGSYSNHQYSNCWFASAGKVGSLNAEAVGINFAAGGNYAGISFDGGIIYNCSGSGVLSQGPGSVSFTGTKILSNGGSATTNKYGVFLNPSSAVVLGIKFTGCTMSNPTWDFYANTNARDFSANGNFFFTGAYTAQGASCLFQANYDRQSSTVASASTIAVPPTIDVITISGTTNILGANATYKGHRQTWVFQGALTVTSAQQNLQLNGNFTTAAGSALTLVCDGATWYEVGRKS